MRSQPAIEELERRPCTDPENVRSHLARILESPEFLRSPRLARFLTYVVETALAGNSDHIKESLIAVEVYGRSPDYNPQIDSTVRVEAGRLRARLRQYYDAAGRSEPLRIELPKGSYVPAFHRNECFAEPSGADNPGIGDPIASPCSSLRLTALAAVASLAFCAAAFVWWGTHGNAVAIDSMAVSPFVNLSGDSDTKRFSDGLTEELTTALSRQADLRVVSHVKNPKSGDGVQAVLQGSVRRDGNRITVTTQLIDADSGHHLWANRYEREAANFVSAQNSFAGSIATGLREVIQARNPDRTKVEYVNDDTMALFHRAHDLLRIPVLKNGPPAAVPDTALEAVRLFREITIRSPRFAEGWAGLAEAAEWEYEFRGNRPSDRLSEAKAAALRAVQVKPDLIDGWMILTSILFFREWDFKAAETACLRAIELDARNTSARQRYVDILRVQGRPSDAQSALEEAIKLQPAAAPLRLRRAMLLYEQKQYDQALIESRAAAELTNQIPVYPMILWVQGLCLEQKQLFAEAERVFRSALAIQQHDPWSEPALGHLLAQTNRRSEAEAILAELRSQAARGRMTYVSQAVIHTALGQTDKALAAIEKAWIERDDATPLIFLDPRLQPLRSESRARALLRRITEFDDRSLGGSRS